MFAYLHSTTARQQRLCQMTHCIFRWQEDYANYTIIGSNQTLRTKPTNFWEWNWIIICGDAEAWCFDRNAKFTTTEHMLRSPVTVLSFAQTMAHAHTNTHTTREVISFYTRLRCLLLPAPLLQPTHFNNSKCFHFIFHLRCIILKFAILNYSKCTDGSNGAPLPRYGVPGNAKLCEDTKN